MRKVYAREHNPDYTLLIIVFILITFGLFLINSASMVLSENKFGSTYYYVWHQIIYGLLPGIMGLIIFSKLNYNFLRKVAPYLFVASLFLMFLVFLPKIGYSFGGAHRWIKIGSFTFQPSEFLKITAIIYFAAWLESTGKNKIQKFKDGFLPFMVLVGITGSFLVFQPDIGTLGVICFGLLFMFIASGGPKKYILLIIVIGIVSIFTIALIRPYSKNRLEVFLNPEADILNSGYQINQSLIGIGAGGVYGLGFGYSRQKYNYLPEPVGDSVFSIAAEELGFIGSVLIIFLYILFIWRVLKIANGAPDDFSRYVAVGIASFWGIQSVINISATSGAIPLTGIPLPFISYGGTSLIALLVCIGIALNISKMTKNARI